MTLSFSQATTALEELIDPGDDLRLLGSGFRFTEGPAWSASAQALVFSDIPGDTRYRWTEERGVEVVQRPNFMGNGMVYERSGDLLVCEHESGLVSRYRVDGTRELAAWHYQGRYFNSPNDVVTRSDGSIYFSDPTYALRTRPPRQNTPGRALNTLEAHWVDFQGVYRVPAGGGAAELVVGSLEFAEPNGLCFSPDERVLYVDDVWGIKAFDVDADGTLGPARVFLDGMASPHGPGHGVPDGMRCDERGNVWCTGPDGVWVISSAGHLLGVLNTPEVCANLVWGGPDWHTLFLCTSTSVHSVPTRVGPAPLPYH